MSEGRNPGTYHEVQGEPSVARKDLTIGNATFPGLLAFVRVRKDAILKGAADTMLVIDEADQKITLKMREHGGHKATAGEYIPATTVEGKAEFTDDHKAVKQMMAKKWNAQELGLHIRTLRHLFAEEGPWVDLVGKLRSVSTKITHIVEDIAKDTGDKKKSLETVTDSVPFGFVMRYSIHNGTQPVDVRLDAAYDVKGSSVEIGLISPNLLMQEREAVEAMMQKTQEKLKEYLGDAIPFVLVN